MGLDTTINFGFEKKLNKIELAKFFRILQDNSFRIHSYDSLDPKIRSFFVLNAKDEFNEENLLEIVELALNDKIDYIDFTLRNFYGWGSSMFSIPSFAIGTKSSLKNGLFYLCFQLREGFPISMRKPHDKGYALFLNIFFKTIEELKPVYAYFEDNDQLAGSYTDIIVRRNGKFGLEPVKNLNGYDYNVANFFSSKLANELGREKVLQPTNIFSYKTKNKGLFTFDKGTIDVFNLVKTIQSQAKKQNWKK